MNILSDLFPGVNLGDFNLGAPKGIEEDAIEKKDLMPVPSIVEKIWQLLETLAVRQELMLERQTGYCMTANYKALQFGTNRIALDVEGSSVEELAAN